MKVGSLVECLATATTNHPSIKWIPQKGQVYTVREIYKAEGGGTVIRLEEGVIGHCLCGCNKEIGADITKFRELQPPMNVSELIEELLNEPQPC